jgi:hypothetical protein
MIKQHFCTSSCLHHAHASALSVTFRIEQFHASFYVGENISTWPLITRRRIGSMFVSFLSLHSVLLTILTPFFTYTISDGSSFSLFHFQTIPFAATLHAAYFSVKKNAFSVQVDGKSQMNSANLIPAYGLCSCVLLI